MPAKTVGLAITAGLVAMAAVIGGFILFASGKASDVNLTTASLVPEDAGIYFALNTDLTSSEWVNTFKLAERLGADDPEDELKDGADEAGFDWDDDVAPFLGGNAAIFVRGLSIDDVSAEGAVIVRCKDAKRALEVIDFQAGLGDEDEYEGVEYHELMTGGYVAVIGDHLVIAFDVDSLEAVIDVHGGKTPSLASRADFKQLRDELTANFLGFLYVNAEDLVGDFLLDDPVVKAALRDSGTSDLVFKPSAFVIGAKRDGFEFQAASLAAGGPITPMLSPRDSKLIKYVPADAAMFFSTVQIAETWDRVVEGARDQIDDAIREQGEYDSLDDALRSADSEIGIESLEDIIHLLQGETAFAMWFPGGTQESAEGLMLAEVDQAKAEALLKAIAAEAPGAPRTVDVKGHPMTTFEGEDGESLAWAFLDGNLLLGSKAGVERALGNDKPALSSDGRYKKTVEQMPTKLGTYAYFDLSRLLSLAQGGIPAELDEVEEALSAVIINVVDERDIVRISGILAIED